MAKQKTYSAAEKRAFKAGMARQYNNDHPLYSYAGTVEYTRYDERGRKDGDPHYGSTVLFRSEEEAKKYVAEHNRRASLGNELVMQAVKAKKVDVYDSAHCTTERAMYKRIQPTRKAPGPMTTYRTLATPTKKK